MAKITYVEKQFRAASLAVIEQANAIITEYRALGFDLTLRQLYYQFISRDAFPDERRWSLRGKRWVRDPNGTKNAEPNYAWLGELINDARLAGLVDWDALIDRTRNLRKLSAWDSPGDIIKAAAQGYHIDLWRGQAYYVEVWIEKDALVGVIEGVCERWDVPYFACRGYTSQSEMWGAARRLLRYQKYLHRAPLIIHLGDHDPSGIDMTRDITDRLQMFVEHDAGRSLVEVRRIALNMDQIEQYSPPPNPAKLSDSRATGYIEEYGDESWELDALRPDVISTLIENEILNVLDVDRFTERQRLQRREQRELQYAAAHWDELRDGFEIEPEAEPEEEDEDETGDDDT